MTAGGEAGGEDQQTTDQGSTKVVSDTKPLETFGRAVARVADASLKLQPRPTQLLLPQATSHKPQASHVNTVIVQKHYIKHKICN
jgi:hypothetical protein